MTQDQKVVALMKLLGTEVTEAVLSQLRPARAAQIRSQLNDDAVAVSPRKQLKILEEFHRAMELISGDFPGLKLFQPEETAESDERASAGPRAAPVEEFVPSGDHLADLERIQAHQVAAAFQEEQPRSIAAVLSQLSPQRTAEILSLFPEKKREAVVRELSSKSQTHPVLMERMAGAILARAMTMPSEPPENANRIARLAAVLRAIDRGLRRQMLDAIREEDPETATELLEQLYEFDDVKGLKDRQIQRLLGEVDATTIATALYGADEDVREKLLSNLSRRARETLEEEMSFQADVPAKLVEQARKSVALAIARLDEEES